MILIDGGAGIRLLLERAGTRVEDSALAGFAALPGARRPTSACA